MQHLRRLLEGVVDEQTVARSLVGTDRHLGGVWVVLAASSVGDRIVVDDIDAPNSSRSDYDHQRAAIL